MEPFEFFNSSRGIRQGSPRSPLLFLLIIEGVSRIILNAKEEGEIKGVKVSVVVSITHLLFVLDVLIFGNSFEEGNAIWRLKIYFVMLHE